MVSKTPLESPVRSTVNGSNNLSEEHNALQLTNHGIVAALHKFGYSVVLCELEKGLGAPKLLLVTLRLPQVALRKIRILLNSFFSSSWIPGDKKFNFFCVPCKSEKGLEAL